MTDIIDVKKKIREMLLADTSVKSLIGTRVYVGWFNKNYALPCITIIDVSETGVQAELGAANDEFGSLVQVDVWCKETSSQSGFLNRDELTKHVKNILGKMTNFQAMRAAGFTLSAPSIRILDEPDATPPIYRKVMQYPVTYYESYS